MYTGGLSYSEVLTKEFSLSCRSFYCVANYFLIRNYLLNAQHLPNHDHCPITGTDIWGGEPFSACFGHKVIIRFQLLCILGVYLEQSQRQCIPVAIVQSMTTEEFKKLSSKKVWLSVLKARQQTPALLRKLGE